jgi:2-C-methyl-D-erythritol 4-phosphate cytidylyltransferase
VGVRSERIDRMGPASGADTQSGRPVGAVVIGTGPDVAGIGPVEDGLFWSPLAGDPVVSWSVRALAGVSRINELVLLVASGREAAVARLEAELGRHIIALTGTGDDPLLACLKIISPQCDLVVVHYGNHPLISASSIVRGITVAEEHPGSAVVASELVRETIKRADGGLVVETPPRSELVLLQSPQIYPRAALIKAYSEYRNSALPLPGRGICPDQVWLAASLSLVPFYFSGENDREGLTIEAGDDLPLAEVSLRERE